VGYRRHEDGGTVREGTAGGVRGRDEPAGSGAGVWAVAQDGWDPDVMRIVGSGVGQNRLECKEGSGTHV